MNKEKENHRREIVRNKLNGFYYYQNSAKKKQQQLKKKRGKIRNKRGKRTRLTQTDPYNAHTTGQTSMHGNKKPGAGQFECIKSPEGKKTRALVQIVYII